MAIKSKSTQRTEKSRKKPVRKLAKKLGKKLSRRQALRTIGILPIDAGVSSGVPSSTGSLELQAQTSSETLPSTKKDAAPSVSSAGAAVGRKGRPSDASVPREESPVKSAKSARLSLRLERQQKRLAGWISAMERYYMSERNQDSEEEPEEPPPQDGVLEKRVKIDGELDFSDLGNSIRLATRYGRNLKFCEQWNKWLWWNGKRWVEGKASKATQYAATLALDTMKAAWKLGKNLPPVDDPGFKDANKKYIEARDAAKTLHSTHRISAMVKLASQSQFIAVDKDAFDPDPWLFNANNGTINLRTGVRSDHKRENLMMKISSIDYYSVSEQEDLPCPKWLEFIDQVTCQDKDLASYLRRAIGYMLTGSIGERALFIFYGLGSNGKGTFIRVLQSVFGDYAQPAPQGMLEEKHSDDHPSRIASLYRARMAVCAEVERGRKLAEGLVKDLTGGDRLAARRMREDFWYFNPTHKLILQGNYKPVISGTDYGIWDRIHIIPWNATFSDENGNKVRDKYQDLLEEAPGILAWAVRGCLEWQQAGKLVKPDAVIKATKKFRDEMDHVRDYVKDRLYKKPGDAVSREDLREDYEAWATAKGYPLMLPQEFTSQARVHIAELFGGIDTKGRVPDGPPFSVRIWKGVKLIEELSPELSAKLS